jgi:predicted nucleotidyltransferase
MGTNGSTQLPAAPSALADALFTPVQQRVLGILFGQPARRFQSAELIRLASSGTGATHRVLQRLAEGGLVRVTAEGRRKYYQANDRSPVYDELLGLIRKSVGLAGPLYEALAPIAGSIRAAFVYGSIAKGEDRPDSDVDLIVIADQVDYPTLFEALQSAELKLRRAVNPNLMTLDDWRRKRQRPDGFAARVHARPRLFVLGGPDDLQ